MGGIRRDFRGKQVSMSPRHELEEQMHASDINDSTEAAWKNKIEMNTIIHSVRSGRIPPDRPNLTRRALIRCTWRNGSFCRSSGLWDELQPGAKGGSHRCDTDILKKHILGTPCTRLYNWISKAWSSSCLYTVVLADECRRSEPSDYERIMCAEIPDQISIIFSVLDYI